jgi:hypothetical protein
MSATVSFVIITHHSAVILIIHLHCRPRSTMSKGLAVFGETGRGRPDTLIPSSQPSTKPGQVHTGFRSAELVGRECGTSTEGSHCVAPAATLAAC